MKKLYLIILASIFLISCGTVKEAGKVIRNEKIITTDEFLVKKRDPLVLPPNYEEIPEPGTINEKKENEETKIKKILKSPKTENISKNPSTVEESILTRIGK